MAPVIWAYNVRVRVQYSNLFPKQLSMMPISACNMAMYRACAILIGQSLSYTTVNTATLIPQPNESI